MTTDPSPGGAAEPLEVEVKLAIEDAAAVERIEQLIEAPDPAHLAGFRAAGPKRIAVVVDRYLDTADGLLELGGARIRLREAGGGVTATLKRRGVVDASGVTSRVELEGPATPSANPRDWPPSAARRALEELVGAAPLVETARLRQQRHVRDVVRGDT